MPKLSDQMGHDDLTEGIVTTLHLHPTGVAYVIGVDGREVVTGGSKGYLPIPFDGTITGWVIVANQVGSIVVDVRRTTYGDFPTTVSMAGTEKPTLVAAQKARDDDLTTWTIAVLAGDVLEFVVESAAVVKQVTVMLEMEK